MNLPSQPDIERLTLGYCLKKQAYLDDVRGSLEADDFSLDKHRRIWRRMCDMYDAGKAVDRITVYSELAANDEAESIGGLTYIIDLDTGLPDNPQMSGYIQRLKDSTLRRRMVIAAESLGRRAGDETEPVDEVLSGFAQAATDLAGNTASDRQPISTHELIQKEGVSRLLETRRAHGIDIPWPELNGALSGLSGGQMVILMAATSRGKTSFALQAATHAAVQGKTPVIWTMEMSPRSLFQRMVNQLSGVWCGKRQMTLDEREAQNLAIVRLDDHPIYFDRHSRTVGSFIASLRQIKARTGVGVAIVDYLQLIRASSGKNRAQEVSDNSRALKLAAMDLNIPFLVLSQVDRGSVKGDGRIGLHSAKESGDIENDADAVLWIEAGELSRETDTPVSLHVGKQREGPAGFSIPMMFRPTSQTFVEVAK